MQRLLTLRRQEYKLKHHFMEQAALHSKVENTCVTQRFYSCVHTCPRNTVTQVHRAAHSGGHGGGVGYSKN